MTTEINQPNNLNPITHTEHDGLCEQCSEELTYDNVVEGDLGFYCSEDCMEVSEWEYFPNYREDFHSDC